jgi:multiple sugar transport system substrate-binding protein
MLAGLAGLGATPPCPECVINPSFLAENSGIVTHITGTGNQATPTSFGEMTVLGMTSVADRQTAVSFADYWFNQGYEQWLAVETERKVPMRWGTQAAPRRFIDAWGTHPIGDSEQSLQDIYGADIVAQLREGIAASPRWGIPQGQGALVTQIYEQLTLSVILQEMLSGYFGSEQTIMEAYHQIIELIPDYQFLPAVEG